MQTVGEAWGTYTLAAGALTSWLRVDMATSCLAEDRIFRVAVAHILGWHGNCGEHATIVATTKKYGKGFPHTGSLWSVVC